MKKPLAIMPAAKSGFENGYGLKCRQPRLVHVLPANPGSLC